MTLVTDERIMKALCDIFQACHWLSVASNGTPIACHRAVIGLAESGHTTEYSLTDLIYMYLIVEGFLPRLFQTGADYIIDADF